MRRRPEPRTRALACCATSGLVVRSTIVAVAVVGAHHVSAWVCTWLGLL
jgi:hypothetical protein